MQQQWLSPMSYRSLGILPVVLLATLFAKDPVHAAADCYDDSHYPAVYQLERSGEGFVAYLGGKFLRREGGPVAPVFERPTVVYSRTGGWKVGTPARCTGWGCYDRRHTAKAPVPPPLLSHAQAVELRPELKEQEREYQFEYEIKQRVTAWAEHGGAIWFGIGFYEGEGVTGVGGIGRYDPTAKQMEVRRPALVRDASIGPILYDEEVLWLGTYGAYECLGNPPVHGLLRYDWKADRIESFERTDQGPCGFLVHDLFLLDGRLWVATDLGLSVWDRNHRQWEHFLPDPNASPPVKPIHCDELYRSLLAALPRDMLPAAEFGSYFLQLRNHLEHFRPGLVPPGP